MKPRKKFGFAMRQYGRYKARAGIRKKAVTNSTVWRYQVDLLPLEHWKVFGPRNKLFQTDDALRRRDVLDLVRGFEKYKIITSVSSGYARTKIYLMSDEEHLMIVLAASTIIYRSYRLEVRL